MAQFEPIINRHERRKITYKQNPDIKGGVMCDGKLKEVDTKKIICPICGHIMDMSSVQMSSDRGEDWCEPYYQWQEDLGSYNFDMSHKETMIRSTMYHQDNYPMTLTCRHCGSELNITMSTIQVTGDILDTYYTRKPYGE